MKVRDRTDSKKCNSRKSFCSEQKKEKDLKYVLKEHTKYLRLLTEINQDQDMF